MGSYMKISRVKSTIVAIPLTKIQPSSIVVFGKEPLAAVIVEIETDNGLVGVGESPVLAAAETCKAMIDSAGRQLVGEDPFNVDRIRRKLYARFNLIHFHLHAASWALSGIEMAFWDIIGKSCSQPLYRLMGGGYRKKVKFWGWVPHTKLPTMRTEARRYVKAGFDSLYEKVGLDPRHDIASVRAIREAVGYDIELRIDANQAWTVATAMRLIRKLEKYDLEFVEQPVLMYNLDALRRIRKAVGVPILSHESTWTFYDALNVIKREAADAIQLDPRFDAGLQGFRIAAGMAEAAGMGAVAHSFGELGVATAYMLHAVASSPVFTYANQTAYTFLADDVIRGGMMRFDRGHLSVPERPGIGVELDAKKVRKYAAFYDHHVRGKNADAAWQSPRNLLGLAEEEQDWVPIAAKY